MFRRPNWIALIFIGMLVAVFAVRSSSKQARAAKRIERRTGSASAMNEMRAKLAAAATLDFWRGQWDVTVLPVREPEEPPNPEEAAAIVWARSQVETIVGPWAVQGGAERAAEKSPLQSMIPTATTERNREETWMDAAGNQWVRDTHRESNALRLVSRIDRRGEPEGLLYMIFRARPDDDRFGFDLLCAVSIDNGETVHSVAHARFVSDASSPTFGE